MQVKITREMSRASGAQQRLIPRTEKEAHADLVVAGHATDREFEEAIQQARGGRTAILKVPDGLFYIEAQQWRTDMGSRVGS